LGVLVYAYCVGERSSRRIKRCLCKDVAFRVVAANQCPDHATLARFRRRHQEAIAGVFSQVLGLCVTEGLVQWGVVAINGRKPRRTAPSDSNSTATHGEPADRRSCFPRTDHAPDRPSGDLGFVEDRVGDAP